MEAGDARGWQEWKQVIKGKAVTLLEPAECFVPRHLEVLLTDAAEVSCQTGVAFRRNCANEIIEKVVEEEIEVFDDDGVLVLLPPLSSSLASHAPPPFTPLTRREGAASARRE